MPTITAITGLAPGCGKTTVCLNIAASLSLFEKKCLIVDLDPYSSWSGDLKKDHLEKELIFRELYPFTDCIFSGFEERDCFKELTSCANGPEKVFEVFMNSVSSGYDHVLVDTTSRMDFMSTSALEVCDDIIISKKYNDFDLEAIYRLVTTVSQINKRFSKKIAIKGIVTWGYDISRESAHEIVKSWPEALDDHVMKIFIPSDMGHSLSDTGYTPYCHTDVLGHASMAYLDLCRHLFL